MKVRIEKLPVPAGMFHHLDFPKPGQALMRGMVSISGWACGRDRRPVQVLVRQGGNLTVLETDVFRADVNRYLTGQGHPGDEGQSHGFRAAAPWSGSIDIGFRSGEVVHWAYRLSEQPLSTFPEYGSIPALLRAQEGVCGNVYFHAAEDSSRIVILFNGALTPNKIAVEGAIFQRWSWARQFRHPVLSIADPLTIGRDPILLGWYLGQSGPNALPGILEPVLAAVRDVHPAIRTIGFGSSGGGFAAIGATLMGLTDEAIAVNPTVDALLFEPESVVQAFRRKRGDTVCQSDLKRYGFDRMRDASRITYLQNLHDIHHVDVHYRPFRATCEAGPRSDAITFVEYSDERAGHMPPDLAGIRRIAGSRFADLLR